MSFTRVHFSYHVNVHQKLRYRQIHFLAVIFEGLKSLERFIACTEKRILVFFVIRTQSDIVWLLKTPKCDQEDITQCSLLKQEAISHYAILPSTQWFCLSHLHNLRQHGDAVSLKVDVAKYFMVNFYSFSSKLRGSCVFLKKLICLVKQASDTIQLIQ